MNRYLKIKKNKKKIKKVLFGPANNTGDPSHDDEAAWSRVAASIMAGQELVVPRWHTRVVNLVTQHRHTSSLGLSSGNCLGTISLQWPAISPEKD